MASEQHSEAKAFPVPLNATPAQTEIARAKADGESDGAAGRSMNPDYVNKPGVGVSELIRQAYAKAYVEAREKRGSSRRKTKKGGRHGKRKAGRRKTRGRK